MMATLLDIAARIGFQNHCLRDGLTECCEHSNQRPLNGVSRGGARVSRKATSGALTLKFRIRNKLWLLLVSCWFLAWLFFDPEN
jgi:hypothetical protein